MLQRQNLLRSFILILSTHVNNEWNCLKCTKDWYMGIIKLLKMTIFFISQYFFFYILWAIDSEFGTVHFWRYHLYQPNTLATNCLHAELKEQLCVIHSSSMCKWPLILQTTTINWWFCLFYSELSGFYDSSVAKPTWPKKAYLPHSMFNLYMLLNSFTPLLHSHVMNVCIQILLTLA